jgi:hypothetical protein
MAQYGQQVWLACCVANLRMAWPLAELAFAGKRFPL